MRLPILIPLALSLSAPALAQEQEQEQEQSKSEILVVGQREQERERREQIRGLVGALSSEPLTSALTRFHDACPVAAGLSPQVNQAIAARIRTVAAAAAVPLAKEDCRPNILVIVVPDKREMLTLLRKGYPRLFVNGNDKDVEVVREDGPVAAWHIQVQIDRDGNKLDPDPDGKMTVEITGPSTRLLAPYRPVAVGAIVLIEQEGLVGLNTTQIGDYVAMRAFTTLHPSRLDRASAPTILRVMDSRIGDETPLSLTPWDLGFLKGIYAGNPYRYAGSERSRIARTIIRETDDAAAGE